ncbi:MAG: amine oxidase [Chloroflexota bacterium]
MEEASASPLPGGAPRRIAVIGAGVSGLVAAHLLSRHHHVEVFEREPRAGGHANTVVTTDALGREVPLDVGFIVYSERTYPGFTRLLRELEVSTRPSEMSFSVRNDAEDFEFSSRGARGYLARPRNLLRPSHWRMILDVVRFQRDARRVVAQDTMHDISFGEYLARRRFGRDFIDRLIVPLTAATWSNAPADIVRFPANYLFRFLQQHGVLAPNSVPEWRWIEGGARTYVQRILAGLPEGSVHLGAPVREVRREDGSVCVSIEGCPPRRFDAVVMACHSDQALALLGDADDDERDALGGIRYAPNHVVLHTDARLLPRREAARAAWNYQHMDGDSARETLTMTYDLNRLQRMAGDTHYCVSVNPGDRVDPRTVIAELDYAHPVFSMETLAAQRRLEAGNGRRNTYFAGAYLGYGFHEDGVQSAIRVARRLGVDW